MLLLLANAFQDRSPLHFLKKKTIQIVAQELRILLEASPSLFLNKRASSSATGAVFQTCTDIDLQLLRWSQDFGNTRCNQTRFCRKWFLVYSCC